jgi:hypothetical protein
MKTAKVILQFSFYVSDSFSLVPYKKYFDIFSKNIFCSGKARLATTVFSDSFGLGDMGRKHLTSPLY